MRASRNRHGGIATTSSKRRRVSTEEEAEDADDADTVGRLEEEEANFPWEKNASTLYVKYKDACGEKGAKGKVAIKAFERLVVHIEELVMRCRKEGHRLKEQKWIKLLEEVKMVNLHAVTDDCEDEPNIGTYVFLA